MKPTSFFLSFFILSFSAKPSLPNFSQIQERYSKPIKIPFPENNPYSVHKEKLGLKLFYSRLLDRKMTVYCGGCHDPNKGYEDTFSLSLGSGSRRAKRHSPSILNLAWSRFFSWDGRANTLEEQILLPIQSPYEMNMNLKEIKGRLKKRPEFVSLFSKAFPKSGLTENNIVKSLATFIRTLSSLESPFDNWIKGKENAISNSAKRGFLIFEGKGKCVECHSGWRFTDDDFHDIGINSSDWGRGELFPENLELRFKFKTPGLREISVRSPYMHNGSLKTLKEVIEFYNRGGDLKRPTKSPHLKPLGLNPEEKDHLLEFLKTLSSRKVRENIARELDSSKANWLKWRLETWGY